MKRGRILVFALGPVGGGILGAVVVPVISWIFSPEDVGRFYLLQTVVAVAVILAYLGLDQSYVREFQEVESRAGLLRATFAPALLVFVAVLCAAVPFREWISGLLFGVDSAWLFWITAGCILASLISRQQSLVLRMSERAFAFSASQLLPKFILLAILAVVGLVGARARFDTLAMALLAASVSVMIVYLVTTRHDWIPAFMRRPPRVPRRSLFRFGFPLMLASVAYWGLTACSAFVLRATSDFEQLGVYSVTMSVAGVAAIVQGVFSLVWAPIVYKWVAVGADMGPLGAIARQAAVVVVAVFAGCGSFAWVLDFVLPAEYGAVKYLVFCAMLQPLLYTLSEITGIGLSIMRRTLYSLLSTVVALAVGLGLNLALVAPLGAAGAVIANAVALVVFFVGRTELSALLWRGFPRIAMYSIVILGASLAITTALLGPMLTTSEVVLVWVAYGVLGGAILRKDLAALARQLVGRQNGRAHAGPAGVSMEDMTHDVERGDTRCHPKVLVFAAGYPPSYRGGGPIRTLVALVREAPALFDTAVVTSDRDLGVAERLPVLGNQWTEHESTPVYYVSSDRAFDLLRGYRSAARLKPGLVYVNSFFDVKFAIIPRLIFGRGSTVLVAPRGEFNAGALALKAQKKRIYISVYRAFGLHRNLIWHASSEMEAQDIYREFGRSARVLVRENETSLPRTSSQSSAQKGSHLSAAFLGRLVPKKGLHAVLEALTRVQSPVQLDVWGSREEPNYSAHLESLVSKLPSHIRVRFCGPLDHDLVRGTLAQYEILLMPTAGENFGHVIAEALSVACPVMCTPFTPWTELLKRGGGVVVGSSDPLDWAQEIDSFASQESDTKTVRSAAAGAIYDEWRSAAKGPHVFVLCQRLKHADA